MQGSNRSKSSKPKSKDGTQESFTNDRSDANWFGTSQEPQEEFIENDPYPVDVRKGHDPATSEGRPTIGEGEATPGDESPKRH